MPNKTDIANIALAKFREGRITSIESTTDPVAVVMNDQYDHAIELLLEEHRWNFAGKRVTLTKLAEDPPFGWDHQYALPSDCIRLKDVNGEDIEASSQLFSIEGTNLLTNDDVVTITYVAKVTDTNLFSPSFVEALSFKLASITCGRLTGNTELGIALERQYTVALSKAIHNDAKASGSRDTNLMQRMMGSSAILGGNPAGLSRSRSATVGSGSTSSGSVAAHKHELTDLLQTGATDGQAVVWNDTEGQWEAGDVAAGGDVSTDAIFDAAGDLVVGTGADTAAKLPIGANGLVLKSNGTTAVWDTVSGTGDVVGDASSTDEAIARFDGVTGKAIQNSSVTIDDSGNIATTGTVDNRDLSVDGAKLDAITGANTGDEVQATQAVSGIAKVATSTEINTGTLDNHMVTPLGLAGSQLQADVTANNAKVSNVTHNGEVTGSTSLTIANRTGLDAGVVTGTAGTADNVSKWNADGDLVDSALVEARVINSMGTGLVEGGVLSINADTSKFDISAGHGVVIDEADPDAPIVYNVAWSAFTAQTVTNLFTDSATYISIDSAGSIVQSVAAPVASDGQLKIFLGQLGHSNNTSISATVIAPTIFNNGTNLIRAISETLGVLGTGNEVSANGANLSINKAVGTLVKEGINFEAGNTARHTKTMVAQVLATIRRRTQTGGSGTATTIDPANYDVAGTVTAVPSNKYTNQRVYLVSSGNIVVQYGQTVHNSLSEATSQINSESFVLLSNLEENAKLIGVISVKNNATDLTNAAQATFSKVDSIAAPSGSGVSDHGGLTGLADDDHTQYSLITSQAGAPSSIPTRVGEVNVDLTSDDVYISADTTGSGDWKLTTGAGGDVTKVGIPLNNQIGIWTGDGTLEGDSTLTYNGTTLSIQGAVSTTGTINGRAISSDGAALDAVVTSEADAIHDDVAGEIAAITPKATPVSGDFLIIEDSAAGNAKKSITIGDLPSGGGGSVATDAIWDVAGDLAVGSGADTAAKLPIGGESQILKVVGGAVTWATATGGGDVSDGDTLTTGLTFPNTGLHILDTNASHDMIVAAGSDLTADRTLTLTTGDANRTLTLGGDSTINGGTHSGTNTGDQTITLTGDVTGTGTGSFATTIEPAAVDIAMLSATGTASPTTYLRGDNTWATVAGGGAVACEIGIACGDETTVLTASAVAKVTFTMPYAMTLTEVMASVVTAPTTTTVVVDIHDGAATIMDTHKLDILTSAFVDDNTAVVSDTALAKDAIITVYVDTADVAAAGLKIWLIGTRT